MPVFSYDGIDKEGKRAKGNIEAPGKNAALSKLQADGILVAEISQASQKKRFDRLSFSFKKRDCRMFFFSCRYFYPAVSSLHVL